MKEAERTPLNQSDTCRQAYGTLTRKYKGQLIGRLYNHIVKVDGIKKLVRLQEHKYKKSILKYLT